MKAKCLIVDDEPLARKLIASHVAKVEALSLIGECTSAFEAINQVRTKTVDLIFLDIQMPELSGLDFIRSLKNPPSIILTTAHRDFAIEAFDLDVLDYLLKPISFERFLKSVNKYFDKASAPSVATHSQSPAEDFIYVKADRKSHKMLLNEILYIESLDDYVKIFLKGKTLVSRENISTLEQKLPAERFVRIHRSFIVAVKEISTVSGEGLQVGSKELPFGRAFKKSAMSAISFNKA
jgi:DNA-binding LytR/AlgR family response regulator